MLVEFMNSKQAVTGTMRPVDGGVEYSDDKTAQFIESLKVKEPRTFAHLTSKDGERFCRAVVAILEPPYFYGRIVEDEKSLKGGEGSGNWAHSGRPGFRGGSGKGGGEVAKLIAQIKSGGFTFNPVTHKSPTEGFVVSLPRDQGMERVYALDEFKGKKAKEELKSFLNEVKVGIKDGTFGSKVYAGAWVDSRPPPRVVFDVNEVYKGREGAINVGIKREQDAIYDIKKHEEIDLRRYYKEKKSLYDGRDDGGRDGRGDRQARRRHARRSGYQVVNVKSLGQSIAERVAELKAVWNEAQHPRDDHGKFADAGGFLNWSMPSATIVTPIGNELAIPSINWDKLTPVWRALNHEKEDAIGVVNAILGAPPEGKLSEVVYEAAARVFEHVVAHSGHSEAAFGLLSNPAHIDTALTMLGLKAMAENEVLQLRERLDKAIKNKDAAETVLLADALLVIGYAVSAGLRDESYRADVDKFVSGLEELVSILGQEPLEFKLALEYWIAKQPKSLKSDIARRVAELALKGGAGSGRYPKGSGAQSTTNEGFLIRDNHDWLAQELEETARIAANPTTSYHGTAGANLDSILKNGLRTSNPDGSVYSATLKEEALDYAISRTRDSGFGVSEEEMRARPIAILTVDKAQFPMGWNEGRFAVSETNFVPSSEIKRAELFTLGEAEDARAAAKESGTALLLPTHTVNPKKSIDAEIFISLTAEFLLNYNSEDKKSLGESIAERVYELKGGPGSGRYPKGSGGEQTGGNRVHITENTIDESIKDSRSAKVGDTFLVYRLGSKTGGLENRNAANALGVAHFIEQSQDYESPVGGNAGNTVSVYAVKLTDDFQPYQRMNAGDATDTRISGGVGKHEEWDAINYSFRSAGDGYEVQKLGAVSLTKLEDRLAAKYPHASHGFGMEKWGDDVIREWGHEQVLANLSKKSFAELKSGNENSGNWGHSGRPGLVGGSGPGGGRVQENEKEYSGKGHTIPKSPNLSDKDRAIERKFATYVINNRDAVVKAYQDKWRDKKDHSVVVINTDNAREASKEYHDDRSLSAAVHEPSSFIAKEVYKDELAKPIADGKDSVLFMGGGTGAGKSRSVSDMPTDPELERKGLVYDTNLSSFKSAVEKIDAATTAGRSVMIVGVYRDPVQSLVEGAFKRAEDPTNGRTVPIKEHANTHVGFTDTFPQLVEHYKDNPAVQFRLLDNSYIPEPAHRVPLDSLKKLDYNQVVRDLRKAADNEYAKGNISKKTYEATIGQP